MFLVHIFFFQLCNHNFGALAQNDLAGDPIDNKHEESTAYYETGASSRTPYKHTDGNQETSTRTEYAYNNWTKEELSSLLEKHGYLVKRGYEGWPLVMIGDIAYTPEELLPELGALHGRRNLLATQKLWVNGDKETVIPYYYDTQTQADQTVFEAAVKSWSDSTCIKFSKKSPNTCNADLGEGAVCVGNFQGCWSKLGKVYGPGSRHSQQMSVMPNGCEDVAAAHEFGHALGLAHEMARVDREKDIHVVYENIDLDLNKLNDATIRSAWYQGAKCDAEQLYDAPKPYDPMSLMQYATSSFAKEDQRPVYIHKNPKYQYMFNYHRAAGYMQSHYDKMIINIGYQCIKQWTKSCEASGQSVPKCQNFGYLGKSCKCLCPKGYSGSTCATKDGPIFPVMDRAKAMVDVTQPGLVDMKGKGMHDENHDYPKDSFIKYQFITVVIKSGDETRISVDVSQDFEAIKRDFQFSVDMWLQKPPIECQYGLSLYVGHSESGKMRTECISSVMSNEAKENLPVLRSKSNELDIIGLSSWGLCYSGGAPTGRKAMEFKFNIAFLNKPEDHLSVEEKYPGAVGETVNKAAKAITKALKTGKGSAIIIAVVVGLLVLVAAAGGGAYWWFKIREPPDGDESEPPKKRPPSSDDDTSDSSD